MAGKLEIPFGDRWEQHSFPPIYYRDETGGDPRLVAGIPGGDVTVFRRLVDGLEQPFKLLYILHTPRGEGEPGRYESPTLDRKELESFLSQFSKFLGSDARHDVWLRSETEDAVLVWDRHNFLFAYGPLDRFEAAFRGLGFYPGDLTVPYPHTHHYRPEFDADAKAVLSAFNWSWSALGPEDAQ